MQHTLLNKRERTIVRMIADDCLPVKCVAADLQKSQHTINNQLKAIYRKLNIHSQAELSKKYFQDNAGLIRGAKVITLYPNGLTKTA